MARKEMVAKTMKRELRRLSDPSEAGEVIKELTKTKQDKTSDLPGASKGGTKRGFTLEDWDKTGVETFIPDETISFTLNGVTRQFLAGVEGLYPKAFITAYHNRKRELRSFYKALDESSGFATKIELGAGALEPE